jgi:predicted N-acetyltransferase YhbS
MSMQTTQLHLAPFEVRHIEGALALSRQAGWPHRRVDWEMALALSIGVVALDGKRVVGTTLTTRYGSDCATINMVIVAESVRGRGLGRKLMDAGLEAARGMPCRLIATQEGLPLYMKLGFHETGTVLQYQGVCPAIEAPEGVEWAVPEELAANAALDRQSFGADRGDLLSYLQNVGRFAVLRKNGTVTGFSCLRAFGRGEVIGPVVAESAEDAKKLILFLMAECTGAFVRVDTTAVSDLSPWLARHGLGHVGGGTAMQRGGQTSPSSHVKTFALANQAFG